MSSDSIFIPSLSEFLALRLVNGSGCAGRLEVFYNGTWGSICSNRMSQLTAVTVCKHLNCGDGGEIERDFKYGRGSGPTWLDHIECTEQHSSLWQCQSDPWDPQSCDNRAEETHISCTGKYNCIHTVPPKYTYIRTCIHGQYDAHSCLSVSTSYYFQFHEIGTNILSTSLLKIN